MGPHLLHAIGVALMAMGMLALVNAGLNGLHRRIGGCGSWNKS